MSYPKENPVVDASNTTTAVPSPTVSMNPPAPQPAAGEANGDDRPAGKLAAALPSKVPRVTLRTVFMAILVAMGGFIFGYDTGTFSGG
jgi:hypothetical protein